MEEEKKINIEDCEHYIFNNGKKKGFARKKKSKKFSPYSLINYFSECFSEFYNDGSKPTYNYSQRGRVVSSMKFLINNFGEEFSKDFVRMCTADWNAIREKMKKEKFWNLPSLPDLLSIFSLKDTADIVSAAKNKTGIIFGKFRVSNFSNNNNCETDDEWEEWMNV